MATLHNFTSPNAGSDTVKFYPDLSLRQEWLKKDVNRPRGWDIPNMVPIGPIQRRDTHMLDSAHVNPQITEHRGRHIQKHYLPMSPYTRMMPGDTADGRLLVQDKGNAWNRGWNMDGTHLPLWRQSNLAIY